MASSINSNDLFCIPCVTFSLIDANQQLIVSFHLLYYKAQLV
jgi:hypothetical protein